MPRTVPHYPYIASRETANTVRQWAARVFLAPVVCLAHALSRTCREHTQAMRALQRGMGCVVECCASPFNTYMRNYCSAFPDTDSHFGSLGSFFTFEPTHGSFEANPPFNRQVIGEMFKHMLKLLQNASGPMSFVVVLPMSDSGAAKEPWSP